MVSIDLPLDVLNGFISDLYFLKLHDFVCLLSQNNFPSIQPLIDFKSFE